MQNVEAMTSARGEKQRGQKRAKRRDSGKSKAAEVSWARVNGPARLGRRVREETLKTGSAGRGMLQGKRFHCDLK